MVLSIDGSKFKRVYLYMFMPCMRFPCIKKSQPKNIKVPYENVEVEVLLINNWSVILPALALTGMLFKSNMIFYGS